MELIKETKKSNLIAVIMAAFVFIRAVVLTDMSLLGFDIYSLEISFTDESLLFWILLLLFAALTAIVMTKINNKCGEIIQYICALILADPLFFVKPSNCIELIVIIAGLLCILNKLSDRSFIKNEITLLFFLLISTVLLDHAIYSFVPLALMIYFIPDIENLFKNKRKILTLILSAVFIITGVFLHDFLNSRFVAFDNFIKTYSFYKELSQENLSSEKPVLLLLAIPTVIFAIYFFYELVKNSKQKKKKKHVIDEKMLRRSELLIGISVIAYAISIVGFLQYGSEAFYTANLIIPLTVIVLLLYNDQTVFKVIDTINAYIGRHAVVAITITLLFYYMSVRIFYPFVRNIASYVVIV